MGSLPRASAPILEDQCLILVLPSPREVALTTGNVPFVSDHVTLDRDPLPCADSRVGQLSLAFFTRCFLPPSAFLNRAWDRLECSDIFLYVICRGTDAILLALSYRKLYKFESRHLISSTTALRAVSV